jgi:hypothetical protein
MQRKGMETAGEPTERLTVYSSKAKERGHKYQIPIIQ